MAQAASPEFSIVIPTYDRAHRIGATIASVLAQDDPDFELIVVDDGSRDDTEAVVLTIDDPRIAYYRKANGERGAARNYGASRARGRYVNFVDSDDRLLPHHLSMARLFARMHDHPELFHLGYEVRDERGRVLRRAPRIAGRLPALLLRENVFSCDGVFVRRDVVRQFRFNEDRALVGSEDWELWLRLASRYELRASDEVTSVIVDHGERTVTGSDEARLLRHTTALLESLAADTVFMQRFDSALPGIESEMMSYVALQLAMSGARGRAWKYLRRSIALAPESILRRRFLAVLKRIVLG